MPCKATELTILTSCLMALFATPCGAGVDVASSTEWTSPEEFDVVILKDIMVEMRDGVKACLSDGEC